MPSQADQQFAYVTTPVVYIPGSFGTPDAGRNIFAFYEPPPPTPWVPTPVPPTPTPTPAPTPEMLIAFVAPQSVYAGQRGFRLEVNGDRFTPDAKIYFNQNLLPTTFVNLAKLTADIPCELYCRPWPGAGDRTDAGRKEVLECRDITSSAPSETECILHRYDLPKIRKQRYGVFCRAEQGQYRRHGSGKQAT
jgi:hypothetical protein